jgi:hypothetical protein
LVGAEVGEAGEEVVEAWVGDEGDCGGGYASIDEVSLGEDVVEALGEIDGNDGKLDATESVPRRLFSRLLLALPALEVHMGFSEVDSEQSARLAWWFLLVWASAAEASSVARPRRARSWKRGNSGVCSG